MVNECKAKADENTTSSVAVQETNMRAMTLQNDLEDLKTEKVSLFVHSRKTTYPPILNLSF